MDKVYLIPLAWASAYCERNGYEETALFIDDDATEEQIKEILAEHPKEEYLWEETRHAGEYTIEDFQNEFNQCSLSAEISTDTYFIKFFII